MSVNVLNAKMQTATTMGLHHCICMSVFLFAVFAALFKWLTPRSEFKPLKPLCSIPYVLYLSLVHAYDIEG